jgi:bifunctional polynucleotide phosphatase/kinase
MDFTLIKTKSGGTFPKNADDWVIWDESVLKKLRDLSKDGFKLVIFSNQNGLSSGKIT